MAKKVRRQRVTAANQKADVVVTPQDKKTLQSLTTLADGVIRMRAILFSEAAEPVLAEAEAAKPEAVAAEVFARLQTK